MKKIILLFFLSLSTVSFAQSKNDKIKELFRITGIQDLSVQMLDQFIGEFQKKYPNIPSEYWGKFRKEIKSDDYINRYIPVYDKYYTEKDIDEILKFYQSETGKKVIKTMPAAMNEAMEIGRKWGESIGKKISEEMERDGYLKSPPPSN